MKIPIKMRLAAALAGSNAREFAIGWADGVGRWQRRFLTPEKHPQLVVAGNPFSAGTVRHAASDAAVTFMNGCQK